MKAGGAKSIKLKPCPLCGGKAKLKATTWEGGWEAVCTNIDCALSGVPHGDNFEAAQDRWNRRAPEWIPFQSAGWDDVREAYILEGQLPEDNEEILVFIATGKPHVEMDVFIDNGERSLDSGYTIGVDATRWMPLPARPEIPGLEKLAKAP